MKSFILNYYQADQRKHNQIIWHLLNDSYPTKLTFSTLIDVSKYKNGVTLGIVILGFA